MTRNLMRSSSVMVDSWLNGSPLDGPFKHLSGRRINRPFVLAPAIILLQLAVLSVFLVELPLSAAPSASFSFSLDGLQTIDKLSAGSLHGLPLRRPIVAPEYIGESVHDFAYGAACPRRLDERGHQVLFRAGLPTDFGEKSAHGFGVAPALDLLQGRDLLLLHGLVDHE